IAGPSSMTNSIGHAAPVKVLITLRVMPTAQKRPISTWLARADWSSQERLPIIPLLRSNRTCADRRMKRSGLRSPVDLVKGFLANAITRSGMSTLARFASLGLTSWLEQRLINGFPFAAGRESMGG